jgi:hypothetical protein
MVSLKVVRHLKTYQDTKFHGPTLTGASFASTLENVRLVEMAESTEV